MYRSLRVVEIALEYRIKGLPRKMFWDSNMSLALAAAFSVSKYIRQNRGLRVAVDFS
jgi:hypothetical protein